VFFESAVTQKSHVAFGHIPNSPVTSMVLSHFGYLLFILHLFVEKTGPFVLKTSHILGFYPYGVINTFLILTTATRLVWTAE
jgi:hypothetical protein